MNKNKKWDAGFRRWERLAMRFSDGGVGAEPTANPPATPPVQAPAEQPSPQSNAASAEQAAKTYTESELQAAAERAVDAYKQHLQEATDYNKMTPEEKVVHLEKQMAEEKLSQYTADKLAGQQLPPELAGYVKGKDEAETEERLKMFKTVFDKGIQAGVEARFKTNGYVPKGSGAAAPESGKSEKRQRGVTMQ